MSKRQGKAAASSARVVGGFGGFGSSTAQASTLSYVQPPPDYSILADASVGVIFKNLSKKDDITKAKALDELSNHIEGKAVEPSIVQLWTQMFPRLTIDTSRRVRQLTQTFNGKIAKCLGRRLVEHLPRLIGPWLAALYDTDRAVARAARDALTETFPDPVKISALWDVFSGSILTFGKTAILNETVSTLSDERSITSDDAQMVYTRTIAACLQLIASLLQNSKDAKVSSLSPDLDELLDEKVFNFAIAADASIRRSVHRLISTIVDKTPDLLSARQKLLSNFYVYKALASDQQTSRLEYLDVLTGLTSQFPAIWTQHYSGKKPPASRLCHFLEAGSQGGQQAYWMKCERLFQDLPSAVLGGSFETAKDLLSATRKGATTREDRLQNEAAWKFYITLERLLSTPRDEHEQKTLFRDFVMPLYVNFAQSTSEAEQWRINSLRSGHILAHIDFSVTTHIELERAITTIASQLIDTVRASQPEQADSYEQSQSQVSEHSKKVLEFFGALLGNVALAGHIQNHVLGEILRLTGAALQTITDRNGKPYGTTTVLEGAVNALEARPAAAATLKQSMSDFAQDELPNVASSRSAPRLVKIYKQIFTPPEFEQLFSQLVSNILTTEIADAEKLAVILHLISPQGAGIVLDSLKHNTMLQRLIQSVEDYELRTQAIVYGAASQETMLEQVRTLDSDLNERSKTLKALVSLASIARMQRDLLLTDHLQLLAKVLALKESEDDEIAEQAYTLSAMLSSKTDGTITEKDLKIVKRALHDQFLPLDATLELANTYLGGRISVPQLIECIGTDLDWKRECIAPASTLSICSPLAGAVNLVDSSLKVHTAVGHPRLAICTAELLKRLDTTAAELTALTPLLLFCSATLAATDDQLSVSEYEADTAVCVSSSLSAVSSFVQKLNSSEFANLVDNIPRAARDDHSPGAYYTSLVLSQWLVARPDHSTHTQAILASNDASLQSINVFTLAALLMCDTSSAVQDILSKLSNQLVATLTGADLESSNNSSKSDLIVLSLCLASDANMAQRIAKQRLVFLTKHLLKSPMSPHTESILKILQATLPAISEVYGEHWSDTIRLIATVWTATDLPSLFASLKLFNRLQQMSRNEDANEDLVEALREHQTAMSSKLIELLIAAGSELTMSRPFDLYCSLLTRSIEMLAVIPPFAEESIYPLLHSASQPLQQAAYTLLHKQITGAVESLSVEAALDKKTVRLPNALLSSILDVPTVEQLGEESTAAVQTYLSGWLLVFKHMQGASFKVQSDYADQIKDGDFLNHLLTLILAGLGVSKGKATSLRFDAAEEPSTDASTSEGLQRLLAHLYFLSLKFMPSLVKLYMLELKSRHLPATIEAWTAKYISPELIAGDLRNVQGWAKTTVNEDPEYEKMQVSVGMKSKEINVKYVVDEQTMAIKVVLPEAYPLASAQVIGVHRVAVKEDKWQSWLRNTQGVITFSNGSIIDGLSAWRRNVTGALKGQTECAICYSIISAERQLPNKRCPTCKNLFHSGCLFKWFKTSNASTCPLCRNPFNFN